MKVTSTSKSYLIIDDFFNEFELGEVWKELGELTNEQTLLPAHKTATATDGVSPIKKNKGVFLDDYFKDRNSKILEHYEKLFTEEVFSNFPKLDNEFRHTFNVNFDRTLLSYYEHSDYYKPHIDGGVYTCLLWLHTEPKRFNGGDLELPELGERISIKNNRLLIFPSYRLHSVLPIEMIGNYTPFGGDGRYSITKFLFIHASTGK